MAKPTYHHGDLRRALLTAVEEAITENGVATLSMRDLARRAGVSHTAPTHHFRDRAGLLTAFATEGFEQLAKALGTSRLASNSLVELGVTYIRFAVAKRAMFEVMFRTDLYHADDPGLLAARAKAADALYAAVLDLSDGTPAPVGGFAHPGRSVQPGTAETAPPDVRNAGLAAWSMAHGFATLWLTGAFPDRGVDPAEAARHLFTELGREHTP